MQDGFPQKWTVRTFGRVSIEGSESTAKFRTQKTALIVAYLAVRGANGVSRESLASQFWPDSLPDTALQSLRMALSNVRQVMGPDVIVTIGRDIQAHPNLIQSDSQSFAGASKSGDLETLGAALELVQGPLFEGVDEQWARDERENWHEEIVQTLCRFMDACIDSGNFEMGILAGKRLLHILGVREDIHVRLMKLYIGSGLNSLAIAQYEQLERELDDLYGEQPSLAAVSLLESIPQAVRGTATGVSSYTGLIGRESLVDDLLHEFLTRSALNDAKEAARSIGRYLDRHQGLLVLDNLEQLMPSASAWVERLVAVTKQARILVTSQIQLGTTGESVYPVGPLELPNAKATPKEIEQTAASALFVREAQRANSSFLVSTENANEIARTCARLDGLPLAISLAAARSLTHSPAQILTKIGESLEFVKRRNAAEAVKHSSLRQTIQWSFELLSPQAQELMVVLSAITGKFDSQFAKSLAPNLEVEDGLEELCSVSLLNADTSGKVATFWMFETIRSFAEEELKRRGQTGVIMKYLLDEMLRQAVLSQDESSSDWSIRVRSMLELWENCVRVLSYCISKNLYSEKCAKLLISLESVWATFGLANQVVDLARQLLYSSSALTKELRAAMLLSFYLLLGNQGKVDEHFEILDEAKSLISPDNKELMPIYYIRHATLTKSTGKYHEGIASLEAMLDMVEPSNHALIANGLYTKSQLHCCLADHKSSLENLLAALVESRRAHETKLRINILFDCGSELSFQGHGEESLPYFEEALALCKKVGSIKLEGLTRWQQGDALISMKRYPEAFAALKWSIELVIEADFIAGLKWIFLKVAEALAYLGHHTLAIQLLGKMVEVRKAEGRELGEYEVNDLNRLMDFLKTQVPASQIDRFWAEGNRREWLDLVQEVNLVTIL
ncbi:MAG: hypothetical protein K8R88_10020 [Armatimonadetes bacterium]|nr:hypothetical protein [Armatimonadota bacterium]